MLKKLLLGIFIVSTTGLFAQQQFSPVASSGKSSTGHFIGSMGTYTRSNQFAGYQVSGSSVAAIVASSATCDKIAIKVAVDTFSVPPVAVVSAFCSDCNEVLIPQIRFPFTDSILDIDTTIVAKGKQIKIDTTLIINWSKFNGDTTIIIDNIPNISKTTDAVRVYPNPVIDILHIETEDNVMCLIYDMNGKLALRQNLTNKKQINVSHLIFGNYILKLMKDGKIISSINIIKQ